METSEALLMGFWAFALCLASARFEGHLYPAWLHWGRLLALVGAHRRKGAMDRPDAAICGVLRWVPEEIPRLLGEAARMNDSLFLRDNSICREGKATKITCKSSDLEQLLTWQYEFYFYEGNSVFCSVH